MAGNKGCIAPEIDAGLGLEHAQDGERYRHQRGLRVFGEGERFRRPVPDRVAEPFPERRVDLLEHAARGSKRVGKCPAHADSLTALPGKYECRRHLPACPLQEGERYRGRGSVKKAGSR